MQYAQARATQFAPCCGGGENRRMRIIAGRFRGRKLLSPRGLATRPITDRVKQSLFDILAPLLPGARVYDCFCGTGSLGLECLSRGAAFASFFEADQSAVELLNRNIVSLDAEKQSRVVWGDVFGWFSAAPPPERPIDVVFLDPPYRFLRERADEMRELAGALAARHLAPAGSIVLRHDAEDHLEFAELKRCDRRDYGRMTIEFFRRRD